MRYRNALALMGTVIMTLAALAGFAAFAIDAPGEPVAAVAEANAIDPTGGPIVDGSVAGAVLGSAFAELPAAPSAAAPGIAADAPLAAAAPTGPSEAFLKERPLPTTTTTTTTTNPPPTTTTTTAPRTTTTTTSPGTKTTTTAPPTTTTTTTEPTAATPGGDWQAAGAEAWRPLVTAYFPAGLVDDAIWVIACESNGDPKAVNRYSGAAGLFQFVPSTWDRSSEGAGFAGASPFSAEANIAAAAWLVQRSIDAGQGAWSHWVCVP